MSGEKQATPHDKLISRIESCLGNSDAERHAGQPVYDPYEQWKACVEVLQDALRALTAPQASADDVALVDDFLSAHRSVWANTGDDAERYEYRKEADAARAALLARFAAIRRETIEACARVADTDSGQGYDPYEAAERIAKNIRALAGKEK